MFHCQYQFLCHLGRGFISKIRNLGEGSLFEETWYATVLHFEGTNVPSTGDGKLVRIPAVSNLSP